MDTNPNGGHGAVPVALSSFVGRRAQVDRGVALVARSRLVSLVGPGGSGKTRLAGRVAVEAASAFPAGVSWLDLIALTDRSQLDGLVARVVGVPMSALADERRPPALADALAGGPRLLVLDNCEHLVDAVAAVVDEMLRVAPELAVLTTSREPVGVEGEVVWRIPPLEVPPDGARDVTDYEAVRLFFERAEQAGSAVDPGAAQAVGAICRTLDGMPLAIELAAARAATTSVHDVLADLGDRLTILTGGPRPAPERMRSLAASIAWSVDRCTDAEQVLLRRLGVFAGGFDADAAVRVAVAPPLDPAGARDALAGLVRKSLVQLDPRPGGGVRHRLLETVRIFAASRAEEAGETRSVADRHLSWAAELAEALEPATMLADPAAMDRLEHEMPNLRAALAHAAVHPPSDHAGLRLVTALAFVRARHGHGIARTDLGEAAVEAGSDDRLRGWAHWSLAYARFYGGDFAVAYDMAARGAAEAGDDALLHARCRQVLGCLQAFSAPAAARAVFDESVTTARLHGDRWLEHDALGMITFSHVAQHRPALGLAQLPAAEFTTGNRTTDAWVLIHTAMVAELDGRLGEAHDGYAAARLLADEQRDPLLQPYVHAGLTSVAVRTGRTATLRASAEAMTRPELRFADLTAAFAATLPRIARIDDAPADAAAALVEAGLAMTLYAPFGGPRLTLAGARLALDLGDVDAAERAAEAALAACAANGSALAGACRVVLARVRRLRREHPTALCQEGLAEIVDAGLWVEVPDALDVLGGAALDADRPAEAVRLLAAAASLRERSGDIARTDDMDRARERLDPTGFDALYAEGAALDAPAAAAYARRARGPRRRPSSGWDSLTPTEADVVRLVVAGHSNPEIAGRLYVTRGTVKTHLTHVFAKLGVTGRAELAVAATRRGMT